MHLLTCLVAVCAAQTQLSEAKTTRERARTLKIIAAILLGEASGAAEAVAFGVKAAALYRSLPTAPHVASSRIPGLAYVEKSIPYLRKQAVDSHDGGSGEMGVEGRDPQREVLDAYVPVVGASGSRPCPVVCFIHGGIWASGDKWCGAASIDQCMTRCELAYLQQASTGGTCLSYEIHQVPFSFSASLLRGSTCSHGPPAQRMLNRDLNIRPSLYVCNRPLYGRYFCHLATRLCQEGCVVIVPQYTLYPSATADVMTREVLAALDWTLEHCSLCEKRFNSR